jgi:DNA-3-methyladenine glycosylase
MSGAAPPPGADFEPASGGCLALPSAFFDRPPLDLARDLLGAVVVRGDVAVRLTEVEAYDGPDDPASHAWRGRTRRNAAMFGPPGHAYVYFTYGMHWCLNVVAGPGARPSAVLLRAGEVIAGVTAVRERRPGRSDHELARGPACLARALAVTGELYGADLTVWPGPIAILPGRPWAEDRIGRGPRIGVGAAADRPWRLWVLDAASVSGPRRPKKAAADTSSETSA